MKSRQKVVAVSTLLLLGMASVSFAQTPRADLRGQLDRYRSSAAQSASQTAPQSTRSNEATQRGLNSRPVSQVDLLRNQLLLQQQQRGLRQQVTLVPDGRGGVIAVPVVNPLVPFGVPVGVPTGADNTGAQQQTPQRVNRIRFGK